jgi:hypothetical protein
VNTCLPTWVAPHRLFWVGALAAAACAGVLIPILGDLKLLTAAILVVGLVAAGVLLAMPNRRIALVCAWVFAFPLSLEKVFPILKASYPGFMIAPVVISGVDVVFLVLLVAMTLEAFVLERKVFYWSGPATPYALLVGWVCVLFVLKGPTTEGLLQIIHWVKMLIVLVTFTSAIRTRQELLAVLVTVGVAVALQSLVLGVSYVLKRPIGFSPKAAEGALLAVSGGGTTITRATGTLGHANQQAMFQALFTIPLAALFMVRNWIWRIVMGAVLLLSFCAILLTFSRTSWIACSVAGSVIILTAWRHGRISRNGWLGLYSGALAMLVVIGVFSGSIVTRLTKADDGASLSRVHLAMLSLEHVSNNPIAGVGPGNFINAKLAHSDPLQWAQSVWLPRGSFYEPRYIGHLELGRIKIEDRWYFTSLPAHNKYLLVAAELGLVGLGLFMWYQFRLVRGVVEGLRTADPLLWWVGVALLGAFGASLTEFMLELFYDDKTVLMPLFVNMLMICLARIAKEGQSPDHQGGELA